jgi:hypothetical protein
MYNWTLGVQMPLGEDDGWNLYKGFFQLHVEVLDVNETTARK